MQILFWTSAFFVAYVYIGYPALLLAWARLFPRKESMAVAGPGCPTISIVVAARNEGPRLPARIENLLALDYPADRRQILVVSDGSTDQTIAALRRYLDRIEVVLQPKSGKAAALNAGVARATGEILLFADARQTFAPEAAKALVAPFADPAVGAVSGELILGCEPFAGRRRAGDRRIRAAGVPPGNTERRVSNRRKDRRSAIADGVRYYWGYEKMMRRLESTIGSMLGATGAIYALRRSLWQPLPHDAILDDVLAPMRAVLSGARVVFEPRAQAFDHTAPDARSERRRKVRTLAGNYQLLFFEPRLLLPIVNPVWLQFVSHKIARLLVPYALLALLISSAVLAPVHLFYACAFIAQCVFYLGSAHGAWLAHRKRHVPAPPYTLIQRAGTVAFAFVMMNASAVAGAGVALAGRKVWR